MLFNPAFPGEREGTNFPISLQGCCQPDLPVQRMLEQLGAICACSGVGRRQTPSFSSPGCTKAFPGLGSGSVLNHFHVTPPPPLGMASPLLTWMARAIYRQLCGRKWCRKRLESSLESQERWLRKHSHFSLARVLGLCGKVSQDIPPSVPAGGEPCPWPAPGLMGVSWAALCSPFPHTS